MIRTLSKTTTEAIGHRVVTKSLITHRTYLQIYVKQMLISEMAQRNSHLSIRLHHHHHFNCDITTRSCTYNKFHGAMKFAGMYVRHVNGDFKNVYSMSPTSAQP